MHFIAYTGAASRPPSNRPSMRVGHQDYPLSRRSACLDCFENTLTAPASCAARLAALHANTIGSAGTNKRVPVREIARIRAEPSKRELIAFAVRLKRLRSQPRGGELAGFA